MAAGWIKMRVDLVAHPKIVRISSALRADRFRVIGGLLAVWSVFDAHTETGRLDGYTVDAMDSLIGWPGFSAAVRDAGWLIDDNGQALEMPDFERHNGASAKRRAMEAERKREARSGQFQPEYVRDTSASDADKKRTREEKRREENIQKEDHAPEALPFSSPEFSEAWSQWQKHRTEIRKPLKPTMRAAQLAELAAMGEQRAVAALRHTIAKGWQGIREPEAGAQQQGTLSGFAPRPSLGALQIELNKVRDEIADILHPGGCSGTVEPKGEKRARYDALVARRTRIQAQIEQAA